MSTGAAALNVARSGPSATRHRGRVTSGASAGLSYFTPRGRAGEALPEAGAFAALPVFALAFALDAVAEALWPSWAPALAFAVLFADCAVAAVAFFATA